jgi:general secretion pathway protein C
MKQRINPLWVRRFIILAVMAAAVKGIMLAAELLLPYQGVDMAVSQDNALQYTRYNPSKIFGLQTPKGQKNAGKNTEIYRLESLSLKGIYRDSEHAFILVEEGKETTLLSKGDTFKRYTLVDILPATAIFEKDGRRYELVFKESTQGVIGGTSWAPPVVSQNGFTAIRRKEVRYYTEHFDAIWQNIKIDEIYKGKKLTGFEVKWIKKDSIFAKMGLKEHDIITGINGRPVTSVAEVLKLYKNIKQIDNLTLEIQRNHSERQLDYAIYD